MKSFKLFITYISISTGTLTAQNIGINGSGINAHPSALFDIDAVTTPSLGLLIPRIALQATNLATPVVAPATSLLIYNTATASTGATAVVPGYYYWSGTQWFRFQMAATVADGWNLLGNASTNSSINFFGTTDAQDLVFKTNNTEHMRITSTGNIGIGTPTPHPSAKLELSATNQGFLLTRVDTASISSPAFGLMTLRPADTCLYMFNGNRWAKIGGGGKTCKCKTF